MKKMKIIEPKPMRILLRREFHDTDRDGIANFADCNIWDPNEQGFLHDTYRKLRDKKLARKKRVLDENKRDRRLTPYKPHGARKFGKRIYEGVKSTKGRYDYRQMPHKAQEVKQKISSTRIGKIGTKVYSAGKRVGQFAKDVHEEAQHFNPENREFVPTQGVYYLWVLMPIRDQRGNVIDQQWKDLGQKFDEAGAKSAYIEMTSRGYQVNVSDYPAPKPVEQQYKRTDEWKRNITKGVKVRREPQTPVAHVMIHQPRR